MLAQRRAGISNVLSTIMLSSVLLSIMFAATYFSKDILDAQMMESEFENAKNIVITVDNEVDTLLFKPGSSSILKTSMKNIIPGYTKTGEEMVLTIAETEPYLVRINKSVDMNVFDFNGRRVVSGVYDYNIKGTNALITTIHNGTFGRIHISQPTKLQVSLDYHRILYSYTGKVYLISNQTGDYCLHNTVEIICVQMDFNDFSSSDNSVIIIENSGMETPVIQDIEGNFTVTVSTPTNSKTLYLSEIGGDPSLPSVVAVHTVVIRISVLEGA